MLVNSLTEIENNELLIYGINLTFKKLSKTYPFVTGWQFDENYENYKVVLYLGVVVDYDKFIEYYPDVKNEPYSKRILRKEGEYKIFSLKTIFDNSENLDFNKENINKIINDYYKKLYLSNNDFTIEVVWFNDDYLPLEKRKDKISLSVNHFIFKTDKLSDKNNLSL